MPFVGQGAVEPVSAVAGLIDKEARLTLRRPLPDALIAVTRTRAAVAEQDDLGAGFRGDVRHGHGRFMDISSEGKRGRLVHG